MLQIPPLLADVEGLIKIAIGVIVFIGWVSKLVGQQQQKGAGNVRPPRPAAPRNKQVREELEAFLREAKGEQRPKPVAAESEIELLSADDVEVVNTPRKQKPSPANRSKPSANRPQAVKSKPKPAASPSRRPPGQEAAQRQPETAALGASLQQHVQSHMSERVADLASRDVEPTVDDSVAAHFGKFSGDTPTAQGTTSEAGVLLGMLRRPQSARQAFVLAEILKPPVRLRRR